MTTKNRSANEIRWVKCNGEAHGNPFIDHCMICLPYWEEYPTCPDCGKRVKETPKRFTCVLCHTRFAK